MPNWLIQNAGTLFVGALLILTVSVIVLVMYKEKKKGKSSCASCAGCPMAGKCHEKEQVDHPE